MDIKEQATAFYRAAMLFPVRTNCKVGERWKCSELDFQL